MWLVPVSMGVAAWFAVSGIRKPGLSPVNDAPVPVVTTAASAAPTAVDRRAPALPVVRPATTPPTPAVVRRNLYDAGSVLDAIKRVRVAGSPDEKLWAAQLIRECAGYQSSEQQVYQMSGSSDVPQLLAQRVEAFEELRRRCEGINGVPVLERREAAAALDAASSASTSVFRALVVLQAKHTGGDTRWNAAESRLVGDAVYSGDPLIKREGFFALMTAIDRDAPGGAERRDALLLALADQTINAPLSEFERLAQCAIASMCGGTTRQAAVPTRLQSLYLQAFAQRQPPEAILAIR